MQNLQRLLACLMLYNSNIHVLHWKIKGVDFDPVHTLIGGYYDLIDTYIDDVAEICLQVGVDPVSVPEAIKMLGDDPATTFMILRGSDNFSSNEAFEKLDIMFKDLISLYDAVYKDSAIPASIINTLQEQQQAIRKECCYKNTRRLIK